MVTTRIEVGLVAGRPRLRHTTGLLRAQRLHSAPDVVRVGLVATTALLLGGDEVDLEVRVGAGARLELVEIAGTVAYHGRGQPAAWRTRGVVGPGATLTYRGEPFVVADGAEVERTLDLDVAADAIVTVRDVLVLGREGERGGVLRSRTHVRRGGRDVLVEHLDLGPAAYGRPGLLGAHRVVDTILDLGAELPTPPGAERLALTEPGSALLRWLGSSWAESPLSRTGSSGSVGRHDETSGGQHRRLEAEPELVQ